MKVLYPDYVDDPIYIELVSLAGNAGIKIKYAEKGENEESVGFAKVDEYGASIICMMTNYDYGTNEYVNFVFAHELAHVLVDAFYGDKTHYSYVDKSHVRRFIEADADKVGAALYSLAEMTAIFKAEAKFRDAL